MSTLTTQVATIPASETAAARAATTSVADAAKPWRARDEVLIWAVGIPICIALLLPYLLRIGVAAAWLWATRRVMLGDALLGAWERLTGERDEYP